MNYDVNDYEILSMVADNEEATEVLFRKYQPLIVGLAKKIYSNIDAYFFNHVENLMSPSYGEIRKSR